MGCNCELLISENINIKTIVAYLLKNFENLRLHPNIFDEKSFNDIEILENFSGYIFFEYENKNYNLFLCKVSDKTGLRLDINKKHWNLSGSSSDKMHNKFLKDLGTAIGGYYIENDCSNENYIYIKPKERAIYKELALTLDLFKLFDRKKKI